MTARPPVSVFTAAILTVLAVTHAWADVPGAPKPIPVPPIPTPPQLGTAPRVTLPNNRAPGRPAIEIPAAAELDRLPIPPEGAITPADKSDPAPAPASGVLTGAPASVSPGGSRSQIEEMALLLDPGASQPPAGAATRLAAMAQDLSKNPAARLEIRTFSPAKPHAESAAHRLSLARFLAIRELLTRNGVSDSRIDARALIATPGELNADRVEIYIER